MQQAQGQVQELQQELEQARQAPAVAAPAIEDLAPDAPTSAPRWTLALKAEGYAKQMPFNRSSVVFGRDAACDFPVPISTVSRKHCRIEQRGDDLWVVDLGSRNGTYLNNDRVDEAPFTPSDTVTIGTLNIRIAGKPAKVRLEA